MSSKDHFFDVYDREDLAYGLTPSAELASYLHQVHPAGVALDLGAGAGRNSIALARAGMKVHAIDASERGMSRLMEIAKSMQLDDMIETVVDDVRHFPMPARSFNAIVLTTVLDHMCIEDAAILWSRVETALSDDGVIYAEVHTQEDPGCNVPPGRDNPFPVSETASFVKHYFAAGEMLNLAMRSGELRVLRYEERQEWDYTHGAEHHHGKAILLAVRKNYFPAWFGHPLAFPRQD